MQNSSFSSENRKVVPSSSSSTRIGETDFSFSKYHKRLRCPTKNRRRLAPALLIARFVNQLHSEVDKTKSQRHLTTMAIYHMRTLGNSILQLGQEIQLECASFAGKLVLLELR